MTRSVTAAEVFVIDKLFSNFITFSARPVLTWVLFQVQPSSYRVLAGRDARLMSELLILNDKRCCF